MDHLVKSKYLVFPVNTLATKKSMNFIKDGKSIYYMDIRLDNIAPDFFAYIDVSRFLGEIITIDVAPEMEICFNETDEMHIENLYNENMRPQIHFTPKNGWLNDPNGLIYINGKYHMFFQYNPAEAFWGNPHWGHAESYDLIHWEEKDVALFPDERGAMYSGSAILDEKNLLGLNDGENKAALLYYTTTSPFCQQLSYSTDDFKTIKRYGDKPVIPHIMAANRDPKVVFCEELNCYIIALFMDADLYYLFKSSNLKDWEEFQQIHLSGDCECPDIFMLKNEFGERKWVIMGARDKYVVGHFDSEKFVEEQAAQSLHYGVSGYAGQTFSNLPDDRVIRMVWDRWRISTVEFRGQMGIPMEMSLEKCNDVYYLQANPVKEIEKIYKDTKKYSNVAVTPTEKFKVPLEKSAYSFKLKSEYFDSGKMILRVFAVAMEFDFAANELKIGDCTSPVSVTKNGFDVTIIVDRCSVEMFVDGGKIFVSRLDGYTVNDYNLPYLLIEATEDISLETLEINSMNSIWNIK